MSPEEKLKAEAIFYKIFTNEWIAAYEILAGTGIEDSRSVGSRASQIAALPEDQLGISGEPIDETVIYDTLLDAKSFFLAFWTNFKYLCATERIYLTMKESIELCVISIPCEEVWGDIVRKDTDFETFAAMERHDTAENLIAQARHRKQVTEVSRLERIQAVTRAIETNLIAIKDPNTPKDRIGVPFQEALPGLIKDLENEGVFSTPREISQIIKKLYSHIPFKLHHILNNFKERLISIRDNPQPKLKVATTKGPQKPEKIKIPKMTLDPGTNTLIHQESTYTISAAGLRDAFDALTQSLSPLDFADEFKIILNKIHEHCVKTGKGSGLIQLVHKLHKHYETKWNACEEATKKSSTGMNTGIIMGILFMKHCDMSDEHIGGRDWKEKRDENRKSASKKKS
jgi:hypothetical protein